MQIKTIGPAGILLLAFILLGAGVEKVSGYHQISNREVMVGDTFPARSLSAWDGASLEIPAEDSLTVLLFWATWGSHSKPALNLWKKFGTDYAEHPLTIITINSEHENLSASERVEIDEFVKENVTGLPVGNYCGLPWNCYISYVISLKSNVI